MSSGSGDDEYEWLYSDGGTPPSTGPSPAQSTVPQSNLPPPNLPPPGSSKSSTPKPKRRKRGWLRLPGLILTVWLVFMLAVPVVAWSRLTKVDADPGGDRPANATTTYLLVGTDERPSDTSRGRTDTILLLTYGSGPSVVTSIPRDSLVPIPGRGTQKVNAAYAWGGPTLLVQTLEEATGLRIDGYVQIGFSGLVDVVDALGGIELCPETDMSDRDSRLEISAGCQMVDGETALAYSRNRKSHALGDIARGAAQREVIGAIGDRMTSPATFLNPIRWASMGTTASDALAVGKDVSMVSFGWFAWKLSRAMAGSGLSCTVPIRDMQVNWDADRAGSYFTHLARGTQSELGDLCTAHGRPE